MAERSAEAAAGTKSCMSYDTTEPAQPIVTESTCTQCLRHTRTTHLSQSHNCAHRTEAHRGPSQAGHGRSQTHTLPFLLTQNSTFFYFSNTHGPRWWADFLSCTPGFPALSASRNPTLTATHCATPPPAFVCSLFCSDPHGFLLQMGTTPAQRATRDTEEEREALVEYSRPSRVWKVGR